MQRDQRGAQADQDEPVARAQLGRHPVRRSGEQARRQPPRATATYEPYHAANRSSPCEKTTGR